MTTTNYAASVLEHAIARARTNKTSEAYRNAAEWANKAAAEAGFPGNELYWTQADELTAMATVLAQGGK